MPNIIDIPYIFQFYSKKYNIKKERILKLKSE